MKIRKIFLSALAISALGLTITSCSNSNSTTNSEQAKEVQSLKEENTSLKSDKESLSNQVSELQTTNASNEEKLAAQKTKIDELQIKADLSDEQAETITTLRTANAKLEVANESLEAEVSSLEKQLEDSESESGNLEAQITTLQKKVKELEDQSAALQELVDKYEADAKTSAEQYAALQQECNQYKAMLEEYQTGNNYAVKAIRYNLFTVENLSQETVDITAEQVLLENQKINFRVPGFYNYYVKSDDKYIKNKIAIYGTYKLYNNINYVNTSNYGISIDSMNTSLIPTTKHQEYSYYEQLVEIEDAPSSKLYLTTTRKVDVENTTDFYEFGSASLINDSNFNKCGAFGYRDTSSSNTNTNSYSYYYIYTYTVTTYLSNKKVSDTSVTTTSEEEMFYTVKNKYNSITGELEYSYRNHKPAGSYVYYNENYTGINDGEECYLAIMVTIEKSSEPTDYIWNYETDEYIIDGVAYSTLPDEFNYEDASYQNLPTITPYETVVSKRKSMTSIYGSTSQTADVYYFLYSQIFTYDYQEIKGDSFDKYAPSETTGSEEISIYAD